MGLTTQVALSAAVPAAMRAIALHCILLTGSWMISLARRTVTTLKAEATTMVM